MKLSELQQAQEWGPALYDDLHGVEGMVEKHYRDMQDVEFTVQDGTLYLLQSRSGKRSARAAVCVAASMVRERLITEREALMRINPNHMDFFLHPTIDVAAGEIECDRIAHSSSNPLSSASPPLPSSPG